MGTDIGLQNKGIAILKSCKSSILNGCLILACAKHIKICLCSNIWKSLPKRKKKKRGKNTNQQTPMVFLFISAIQTFWRTIQGYALSNTPYSFAFAKTYVHTQTHWNIAHLSTVANLLPTKLLWSIVYLSIETLGDTQNVIPDFVIWFWRHSLS